MCVSCAGDDDDQSRLSDAPVADDDDDMDDDSFDDPPDTPVFYKRLIKSPIDGVRYYNSRILLTLDEEVVSQSGYVEVDGDPRPLSRIQWLELDDGRHYVNLYIGDVLAESSTFEILSAETKLIENRNLETIPAEFLLPEAGGAMSPVRITLKNTSDRACADIGLRTSGQPDFTSAESLQLWLQEETEGMTFREKALFTLDFVEHWIYFSAPPRNDEQAWRDYTFPGLFNGLGYGWCENHSEIFVSVLQMIGFNADGTRINSLSGHMGAEVRYDGSWHHFDVGNHAYYPDRDGRILSLEEIEGDNASLILDYTDQFGFSIGGSIMEMYLPQYESAQDNTSESFEPQFRGEAGFSLEPDDVLELYPFGFGLAMCVDCDWDPILTGTGVLRRTVNVEEYVSTNIHEPYPILGLLLQSDSNEGRNATVKLTIQGVISEITVEVNVVFAYQTAVDLSPYLDYETLGQIHDIHIEISEDETAGGKIKIEAFFQYSSRITPQISPDNLSVNAQGDCDGLNMEFQLHNDVSEISDVRFSAAKTGDGFPAVLNNAKALVALDADLMSGEDQWAQGHYVEVVSDHSDQIEIIESMGRVDFQGIEPVISRWRGPRRFFGQKPYATDAYEARGTPQWVFWARSRDDYDEDLGPVRFSLLVDGEQMADTQVDFTAQERY